MMTPRIDRPKSAETVNRALGEAVDRFEDMMILLDVALALDKSFRPAGR